MIEGNVIMNVKNASTLRSQIDRICGVGPIPESNNSRFEKTKDGERIPRRGHGIRSIKKCWKW